MFIVISSLVVTFFIMRIIWKAFVRLYKAVPGEDYVRNRDYWNDAGDGSGVNYVQMPNGDVRID